MDLLVTGSREIPESYTYENFTRDLEMALKGTQPASLLCGMAIGIDTWALKWARSRSPPVPIKKFPADWAEGKGAGFKRNIQMVDLASSVIAFWNRRSHGTKQCFRYASKKGKLLGLFNISKK